MSERQVMMWRVPSCTSLAQRRIWRVAMLQRRFKMQIPSLSRLCIMYVVVQSAHEQPPFVTAAQVMQVCVVGREEAEALLVACGQLFVQTG